MSYFQYIYLGGGLAPTISHLASQRFPADRVSTISTSLTDRGPTKQHFKFITKFIISLSEYNIYIFQNQIWFGE